MASPIIYFDSATGSDSLASGAGPSTAVNSTTEGTTVSTSGDGLTVTFSGATDLSGVAADDVIYLVDTTAGNRNFSKILTVDDGADSLTVEDAFGVSLSGLNWAIGGKRKTICDDNSYKLIDNNGAAGDMGPNWTIEFMSGFAETVTRSLDVRSDGNDDDGYINIQGEVGAATRPVFTLDNQHGWQAIDDYARFAHFDIDIGTSTTNTYTPLRGSAGSVTIFFVDIRTTGADASRKWKNFFSGHTNTGNVRFYGCEFSYSSGYGITVNRGYHVVGCKIGHTGDDAIVGTSYNGSVYVAFNEIYDSGGHGIHINQNWAKVSLHNNSIYDCVDDGIRVTEYNSDVDFIFDNICAECGGYGYNVTVERDAEFVGGNVGFNCTSGIDSGNIRGSYAFANVDPDFVDGENGDLTPQADLSGIAGGGYWKTTGADNRYPGAVQPAASGGGGAQLINGGLVS